MSGLCCAEKHRKSVEASTKTETAPNNRIAAMLLLAALFCGCGENAQDVPPVTGEMPPTTRTTTPTTTSTPFYPYRPTDSTGPDRSEVFLSAMRSVRESLKSPSTAKFPNSGESQVGKIGGYWVVNSWVDAQNSFGAMIRYNWTVVYDGQFNRELYKCIGDQEWGTCPDFMAESRVREAEEKALALARARELEKIRDEELRIAREPAVIAWQRKQAEKGMRSSQYDLGMRYLTGNGVERDTNSARFWLKMSADQDCVEAKAALKKLDGK